MWDTPRNIIDPNQVIGSLAEREAGAEPLRWQAREALARGELDFAMLRASDALMLLPDSRETLELVDSIARASSDPLDVVPVGRSVALTACRVRVLASKGDLETAMMFLWHIVEAAPSLGCVVWLEEWLTPVTIQRLGLLELRGPLVALVKLWSALPVSMDVADPRYPNVLATAEVVARVRAEFPSEAPLYTAELLLRRRLGDVRATLALASEAVERFPKDWAVLVSAANAARDAKNPDAALGFARRALAVAPGDGSPLHDAAWAFWDANRRDEARELFEELLEEFPDYPLSPEGRALVARSAG